MFATSDPYSRSELIHTTCSSIYGLVIFDYFNIRGFWPIFSSICSIHYLVTVSTSTVFSQILFLTAVTLFLLKARRVKTYRFSEVDTEESSLIMNGLRYIVCSLVCISIFTCDFLIYPLHKYKSKYFGISLMDFGVVAFMFNAGMLSAISHRFRLRKTVYMIVMGLVRFAVILSGYHADPTEYGTHLNFYFIYALSENASLLFKAVHPILASAFILCVHEMVVSREAVANYIFYSPRAGFLGANREGIISVMPYTAVLLLGKSAGNIVFKKNESVGRKCTKLFLFYSGLHLAHLAFLCVTEPSRRLCSTSFITFSCAAIVFPMSVLYGISCIYKIENIAFLSNLSRFMNPLFLLANLYVLVGNIVFDWKSLSFFHSHICNMLYMLLLFGLPVYLYKRYTFSQPQTQSKNIQKKPVHE